jgi:hypothetical protein
MIRLRTAKRVPENAAGLAYVHSPAFTVKDNLALLDLSYTRPENVAAYGGDVVVDIMAAQVVDIQDLHVSPRSVLHPKIGVAKPMFYSYRVGRGTYSVISNDALPANLPASKPVIRSSLVLLDRQDGLLRDIDWDIDVVANDGGNGYTIDLYLSRRPRADETFKIKYDAMSGATVFPNHIEVINSVPALTQGVDYTLTEQATGYTITGLSPAYYAQGLGLFYRGSAVNGSITITPTEIRLTDDAAGVHTVSLVGRSVPEVASDINELRLAEYLAVPLSESGTARLILGTYSVYSYGLAVRLNQIAHVRYNEETRISTEKPYDGPVATPWYPRVDPGQFLQDGRIGATACKFEFGVPEYSSQTWSYTYGQPWRDMAQDLPDLIGSMMLRLHRAPVKDGSLTLRQDGKDVTAKVRDIDLLNGIVFLEQHVTGELVADYAYEERAFVYTGIDLNTNSLHNPSVFGKYIGIYVTPWKILSADAAVQQTFNTTVRHVVRDTYNEVVSQVQGIFFDDGSDPQAFLLGVFRPILVSDVDEINVVDTRTRGGGITDEIESTDEPESDFFWDIFSGISATGGAFLFRTRAL